MGSKARRIQSRARTGSSLVRHALSDVGFRLELVDVGEKLARYGKEVDT
jgi:hypothetical protein